MDCRILPCYSNKQVLAEINRVIKQVEKKFGAKIQLEVPIDDISKPTDKNKGIVKLTQTAVKEIYHNQPRVMGVGGGTVGAYLRNVGYPAVVYSKLDETMHQPNEYSSIKNTLGDAKVFVLVAMRFK